MNPTPQARYESLRAAFERAGQPHVLSFWDRLGDAEREELLGDMACVNVAQLPHLREIVVQGAPHPAFERIEPAPVISRREACRAQSRGRTALAEGRVAAFTVAGGQGTRLGFEGPKGAFCISPVMNKPLFQLFAEAILATERRYGGAVPWYIMTSPQNDAQTRDFFEIHDFFNLKRDRVVFFKQGVMPAFDAAGNILLDRPHRLALSPDGHGGSLLAMATTGTLADMAARGVEYISYFQVDNPLVACLDPAFIGLHAERASEMSSKTLPKADDLERVGNFVIANGRLTVIEYSDLPESLARARNPDGTRRFDAANIAIHVLSRTFVERLTADRATFALPWHLARKKVSYVNQAGQRVEPAEPNAVKLEAFVFDALPMARNPVVLETSRAEEFSPVKNPAGVDSVETARRDMIRRAAAWLEAAGVKVPRSGDGEPACACEISPLFALDAAQLASRLAEAPSRRPTLSAGAACYLE